jgi:ATP-binding cassette subfamily B protein
VRAVAIDAGYASASSVVVVLARLGGLALGAYYVLRGEITVEL